MTTEEYEQELADQIPVELSKEREINPRARPPDLSDRNGLYQRLGIDVSAKKSDEAPTEKKSYMLPALEPMMSTWTYKAIRMEEHSPN